MIINYWILGYAIFIQIHIHYFHHFWTSMKRYYSNKITPWTCIDQGPAPHSLSYQLTNFTKLSLDPPSDRARGPNCQMDWFHSLDQDSNHVLDLCPTHVFLVPLWATKVGLTLSWFASSSQLCLNALWLVASSVLPENITPMISLEEGCPWVPISHSYIDGSVIRMAPIPGLRATSQWGITCPSPSFVQGNASLLIEDGGSLELPKAKTGNDPQEV